MSSKARSIAREIARRGSVADFDECILEIFVEPFREERRLCPRCRAAAKGPEGSEFAVHHEDAEVSDREEPQFR